jgi:hypothetical protein
MSGLDGLNVPATAQFRRSSKEALAMGIQPKFESKESALGHRNLQQDKYAKAVESPRTGPRELAF